jgi:hypothetical protein
MDKMNDRTPCGERTAPAGPREKATLSSIRARDAEWIVATDSEFAEALHIHPAKPFVWPREMAVADRRHLLALVDQLTSALDDVEDYFDNRADVVDGDYGEPAPNKEMTMLTAIQAVLAKVQR